jgi:hypothetical protein
LLAWSILDRYRVPAVHAQSTSAHYAVEEIQGALKYDEDRAALETAINSAAKGRLLVAVVGDAPHYLAVFTQSH